MESIKARYSTTHQWLKETEEELLHTSATYDPGEKCPDHLQYYTVLRQAQVGILFLKSEIPPDQTGGNSGKLYVCYIFYDQFLKRSLTLLVDFSDGE